MKCTALQCSPVASAEQPVLAPMTITSMLQVLRIAIAQIALFSGSVALDLYVIFTVNIASTAAPAYCRCTMAEDSLPIYIPRDGHWQHALTILPDVKTMHT